MLDIKIKQEPLSSEKEMFIGVWVTNEGAVFNTVAVDSKTLCEQNLAISSRFCKKENYRGVITFKVPMI